MSKKNPKELDDADIENRSKRFSEEWDKKFGAPSAHENVPAEEFLKRLKEMISFTPPEE